MTRLAGGTNASTLTEADVNIAAAANNFFSFNVLFGHDFQGTANDTVDLLHLEASGTSEVVCGFRIVSATDAINIGIGETAPTSFGSTALTRGVWYTVELDVTVDAGTANDGTVDVYLTADGSAASTTVEATQVATLDQGAITDGVFGVQNQLATTTGVILLDNFIQDDARVYPIPRYGLTRRVTQSGHLFVGCGTVEEIILHADGTNAATLEVFDTDNADTNSQAPKARVQVDAGLVQDGYGVPIQIKDGAYASLTGTGAWAQITIGNSMTALVANSDAKVLKHGKGGR